MLCPGDNDGGKSRERVWAATEARAGNGVMGDESEVQ